MLRQACERVGADAANRLALGFTAIDIATALQALHGAAVDVLLDALVLGELPSFAETLEQLKAAGSFIDHLVVAVLRVEAASREQAERRRGRTDGRRPPAARASGAGCARPGAAVGSRAC